MKKILTAFVALAGTLTVGVSVAELAEAAPPTCTSTSASDITNPTISGLTSTGSLVCFRASGADKQTLVGTITGLAGDASIVGIDFRPADGKLYGVGNAGGLYTINPATAAAVKFAQISVPLEGTLFGVDFNPVPNALRIVSNTGQNLRITALDPVAMTATTNVDSVLNNGVAPPVTTTGVFGAAYTNNDGLAQTNTTLFDLTAGDAVAIQSPANAGAIVSTGAFTAAADAVDGDLDIRTTLGGKNFAYALVVTPTGSKFTKVDLLDGQLGTLTSALTVTDIAIAIQ